MKQIYLLTVLAIVLSAGIVDAQPDTVWTRVFGGPADEQLRFSDLLPNGNLRMFADFTVRLDSTYLGLLTINPAGDSLGTRIMAPALYISSSTKIIGDSILQCRVDYHSIILEWFGFDGGLGRSVTLADFGGSIDSYTMTILSDNSIAVAAKNYTDEAIFVRVVSNIGDLLWSNRIQSDYELLLSKLYPDPFGGVVVVSKEGFGSDFDLRLVHFENEGEVIFDHFYTQTNLIKGIWFKHGIYISLLTRWENLNWYRFVTMTREGAVSSVSEGIATDSLSEIGYVTQISDDNFIMTSSSEAGFGGYDSYFAKVSFNGEIVWQKALGGAENDYALKPIMAPDGSLYLVGHSSSFYRGRFVNGDIWVVNSESEMSIVDSEKFIPVSPLLLSAYPNPFNSSTVIEYNIDRPGFVKLGVYDMTGRLVERPFS